MVYFVEPGLTCGKISEMLGVSLRTVRRRMTEFGICIRETYSNISDSELKEIITEGDEAFPNAGYRFITGLAETEGIEDTGTLNK